MKSNATQHKAKQSEMGRGTWDCERGLQFYSSTAFTNDYTWMEKWRNGLGRGESLFLLLLLLEYMD